MSEISVSEAHNRYLSDQVVDVREDFEVQEGLIPSAIHIPLGQLHTHMSKLIKSKPVIVVCRSGQRSALASRMLNQAGFSASTMTGGMKAWKKAGFPISAKEDNV